MYETRNVDEQKKNLWPTGVRLICKLALCEVCGGRSEYKLRNGAK